MTALISHRPLTLTLLCYVIQRRVAPAPKGLPLVAYKQYAGCCHGRLLTKTPCHIHHAGPISNCACAAGQPGHLCRLTCSTSTADLVPRPQASARPGGLESETPVNLTDGSSSDCIVSVISIKNGEGMCVWDRCCGLLDLVDSI